MKRFVPPNNIVRLIVGLAVIVAGVVFTLDNFGILSSWVVLRLWPVVLIAVGIVKMREHRGFWGGFWGSFLALVGLALLVDNLGFVRFPLYKLWPLALVAIGIRVIQRAAQGRPEGIAPETLEVGRLDETAIFGGIDRSIVSADFLGGQLTAVFGGFELDLSKCTMVSDHAKIDVFVLFGGGDIRVPEGWHVDVKVFALFGGTDDKTIHPPATLDPPPKRLVVDGFAIFGGIDLKN